MCHLTSALCCILPRVNDNFGRYWVLEAKFCFGGGPVGRNGLLCGREGDPMLAHRSVELILYAVLRVLNVRSALGVRIFGPEVRGAACSPEFQRHDVGIRWT